VRLWGLGLVVFASIACSGADPGEADVETATGDESVASLQEALFPNCPSSSTNICSSLAGPSGACCRCNGGYGTWLKLPIGTAYQCACKAACSTVSSSLNYAGMCCTCNGKQGTFVRGAISGSYTCRTP